jgi:hypothetical protein
MPVTYACDRCGASMVNNAATEVTLDTFEIAIVTTTIASVLCSSCRVIIATTGTVVA